MTKEQGHPEIPLQSRGAASAGLDEYRLPLERELQLSPGAEVAPRCARDDSGPTQARLVLVQVLD
jgi:hypothetical protein